MPIWHRSRRSTPSDRRTLGADREVANLAFFNPEHFKARAAADRTAHSQAYPSPPMSGSPPLPPNPHREAIYRESRPFQASRQDVYGGSSVALGHSHGPPPAFGHLPPMQIGARPVSIHDRERRPSPYGQGEDPSSRHQPYSPQTYHAKPEGRYTGSATSSSMSSTFLSSAPQQGSQAVSDAASHSSPKTQRKTKGHVASACVPCKRAHLR